MKFGRVIILLFVLVTAFESVSAQEITLSRKNITLDHLFGEIRKQTGYDFLYNPLILEKAKPVNIVAAKIPLRTVLDDCFAGQPLTYTIDQRTIIVREKQTNHADRSTVSGKVVDNGKKPVENVSVFLNNATIGGSTDADGNFKLIDAKPGKYELVISLVGFNTRRQEITINGGDIMLPDITLEPKTIGLAEVVVHPRNDRNHSRNLYFFEKQFLGSSVLADNC